MRMHKVRLLADQTLSLPDVDIHEACTRVRLANVLLLFDVRTLNGE